MPIAFAIVVKRYVEELGALEQTGSSATLAPIDLLRVP
jgi:hypothetical protein